MPKYYKIYGSVKQDSGHAGATKFEGGFELEDEIFVAGKQQMQFFVGGAKNQHDKLGACHVVLGTIATSGNSEGKETIVGYKKLRASPIYEPETHVFNFKNENFSNSVSGKVSWVGRNGEVLQSIGATLELIECTKEYVEEFANRAKKILQEKNLPLVMQAEHEFYEQLKTKVGLDSTKNF